jgi:hypothetical protein
MKLREDILRKTRQPSPTRATFSGHPAGYDTLPPDRTGAYTAPPSRESIRYVPVSGSKVLMVGDSMTVGGFGEAMRDYLLQRFGTNNVAVYASCGSSPEQWLRSGPNFVTRCGYREQTPQGARVYDFQNGTRPPPMLTPKLEDLVGTFQPTTVLIQLGTNWMDGMRFVSAASSSTYSEILDRFIAAVHSGSNTVRKIIWITPPDSSLYSKEVKLSVANLIKAAAQRDYFTIIDSSQMTHYVPRKTGGDGVHYNSEEAKQWANNVVRELDWMLR